MLSRIIGKITGWIVRHRWLVLALWLLPLPLTVTGYMRVHGSLKTIVGSNKNAQSTKVNQKRAKEFKHLTQFTSLITYHHPKKQFDAPDFAASTAVIHGELPKIKCVKRVTYYPKLPIRDFFVAKHGNTQATLVEMDLPVNDYTAAERCTVTLRKALKRIRPRLEVPDLELLVTGTPAVNYDIGQVVKRDQARAELIVGCIAIFLLIWMFRSATAAILPLLTAALAVMLCLTIIWGVAHFFVVSVYVAMVSTMTGLALGLDYALLYVTRFNEEIADGKGSEDALTATGSTAGKAILGSGSIVMLGFSGLFIPPLGFPRSVGFAGVTVVFCTLLATLTLLPVLLSIWRPTMQWPSWGWFRRSHAAVDRFWGNWARVVLRRPFVPVFLAVVIVGLAAPHIFKLQVVNPGHEIMPPELESRRGIERIIEIGGAGQIYPVTVMAEITDGGTWDDQKRRAYLLKVLAELRKWPMAESVQSADLMMGLSFELFGKRIGYDFGDSFSARFISDDRRTVAFDILPKVVEDKALGRLVVRLRKEIPKNFAHDPGIKTFIGGRPAMSWETLTTLVGSMPLMVPMIIIAVAIVMAIFFRSILLPINTITLNSLSIASTYGILVLVFQEGYGLALLGHSGPPPGALSLATPVVMFCILFGISMDYEVFLLSRIQETWLKNGGPAAQGAERVAIHRAAIQEGLGKTGGIISNAALLMIITFAAFLSGSLLPMKEMGFSLALAVALDATLVRMMLVPAMLRFIGPRVWWWPGQTAVPKAASTPDA